MQNLPTPETYKKETDYMPWGILISEVIDFVSKNTPQNGVVLDLLCGVGYLLGELKNKRPDINFLGVDLEKEYIDYAKNIYPNIDFVVHDAFTFENESKFDVVLCTGGLHHISYEKQKEFVFKISNLVKDGGFAVVADPYIGDYSNEEERKEMAIQLGQEYLTATINKGATNDVVEAAITLIENDVNLVEYKSSIKKIEPYFQEYFSSVERHKTWPNENTEYGDYYFVLKK